MASVTLKHLNKTYSGTRAVVKGMHLDIADKEFLVLVGPSGCGKSTTLRMIAGLTDITSGSIEINGNSVDHIAVKDRNIAMVFQHYALYPHMTVYDNLAFGLKQRGESKATIKDKVNRAAQTLGLTPFLQSKPHVLSGGQKQRVALGRAMVKEAAVYLMDEPLSHLDAALRVEMRQEIIQLHKQLDATFIYVTHDQTEAMTMAMRLVVMKDGEMQQIGTPEEIYHTPTNLFVARFIGSPAINCLKGKIIEHTLYMDGNPVAIPTAYQEKLKPYHGKHIFLAIRPEHIHIQAQKTTFAVTVERTEWVGAETVCYARLSKQPLTVRTQQTVTENDVVYVQFDMQHAHFFDPESEERIQV